MDTIIVRKPTPEEEKYMKTMPTWEKEVSEFPWYYDTTEKCLIIEGEATVATDNQTITFKAGDFVIFPKGLSCTWKITKPIKKYYTFED